jgi:hypothetical protein
MLQTEVEFVLPCGYADGEGTLHREGTMRRATAADEILPLGEPRVVKNPAYLVVILLARVVTSLGTLSAINTKVIESLYATDVAYLQELYNRINRLDEAAPVKCPHCQQTFLAEVAAAGG